MSSVITVPPTKQRRRSLSSFFKDLVDSLSDASAAAKSSFQRKKKQHRRRQSQQEKKDDALDGPVAFSSRRIAARRALEGEQSPRLFFDPLAAKLAGTALEDARKSSMRGEGKAKRVDTRVSRIAIRTRWFDDEIEAALCGETGGVDVKISSSSSSNSSSSSSSSVRVTLCPRLLPRPHPTQVVSLGCGMDTRPWRLEFPSRNPPSASTSTSASTSENDIGISWFDVDSPCVLRAKARELRDAGAEVPCGAFDLAFEGEEEGGGEEEDEEKEEKGEKEEEKESSSSVAAGFEFPLKVASYKAVPADLSKRGALGEALRKAGHDARRPTVFVAEGLLMYLGEEGVRACLSSAAEAGGGGGGGGGEGKGRGDDASSQSSPPSSSSSTLVAVTITPSALRSAHERSRKRQEGQRGSNNKSTDTAAASDLLASWNFGCSSAELPRLLREMGWLGGVGGVSVSGGAGKRKAGEATSLLLSVVTRSDMARRYAREAGGRGFEYDVSPPRARLLLLDNADHGGDDGDRRVEPEQGAAATAGSGNKSTTESERGSLFFVARLC